MFNVTHDLRIVLAVLPRWPESKAAQRRVLVVNNPAAPTNDAQADQQGSLEESRVSLLGRAIAVSLLVRRAVGDTDFFSTTEFRFVDHPNAKQPASWRVHYPPER